MGLKARFWFCASMYYATATLSNGLFMYSKPFYTWFYQTSSNYLLHYDTDKLYIHVHIHTHIETHTQLHTILSHPREPPSYQGQLKLLESHFGHSVVLTCTRQLQFSSRKFKFLTMCNWFDILFEVKTVTKKFAYLEFVGLKQLRIV